MLLRNLSLLLIDPGVSVSVDHFVVSLLDECVHEGGLTGVEVSHQADVPDELMVVHHGCQVGKFECGVDSFLLVIKLPRLSDCDHRFRNRLGIFLLDHGLHLLAINILCLRVVLLVLVENDCSLGWDKSPLKYICDANLLRNYLLLNDFDLFIIHLFILIMTYMSTTSCSSGPT